MTMDPNDVRGTMNMILYGIDWAPDLSDASASQLIDAMIDGPIFSSPVDELAEALRLTVAAGALHPEAVESSQKYTESEIFDFVGRVSDELERRRPWSPKLFTRLDITEWSTFGDAAVIARIERQRSQLSAAVGLRFINLPVHDDTLPVILARMRTGEEIAIVGSSDPRSTSFSLLLRGSSEPATAIAHLRELSRLRDTDIIPVGELNNP